MTESKITKTYFEWALGVTAALTDAPDVSWKIWSGGRAETMQPLTASVEVHSTIPSERNGHRVHNLDSANILVRGQRRLKNGETSDFDLSWSYVQPGTEPSYTTNDPMPVWLEPVARDLLGQAAALMAERLR
jgi:hypothetical protein